MNPRTSTDEAFGHAAAFRVPPASCFQVFEQLTAHHHRGGSVMEAARRESYLALLVRSKSGTGAIATTIWWLCAM